MMDVQEFKNWLSASEVASKYVLARNSVMVACKAGNRFTESEAVETSLGWLISPEGAERVFGYRLAITCPECLALGGRGKCKKCESICR